jgi:hypothetical protein
MNSDPTMEYFKPRKVTNGNTAGNGVLYGSSPIVMSCNSRGIVGRCFLLGPSQGCIMRTNGTSQSLEKSA